ncbi:MAG TPA: hypothetical protein VHZ96_13500 [Frankiaceae bacterium]|nr:hypothetical protein [Frankiaceae bacterium]
MAVRHPLLLASALIFAWSVRSNADWALLSTGGRGLFSSSPTSVYAKTPGLQAGPPSLVVVRLVNLLPGSAGEWMAHILLAFLGWYLIYLVERWTVAGSTWRQAPLRAGLTTLVVGLLVLEQWAWLAGETPHVEDGLAILTFVLALRALVDRRELAAALLVGLTVAWKPWAVAALPLLWGCSHKAKALLIGVAIPAACWLPFFIGNHGTFSTVGYAFALRTDSPLRVLGLSGGVIPDWWRTVELVGVLVGAALAARRDWRVAFAAGCALRLLLDPASFRYYYGGLIMVVFLTERLVGAKPWRTAGLFVTAVYIPHLIAVPGATYFQITGLAAVFLSWAQPWRRAGGAHGIADARATAAPELVPVPREGEPESQPASSPRAHPEQRPTIERNGPIRRAAPSLDLEKGTELTMSGPEVGSSKEPR